MPDKRLVNLLLVCNFNKLGDHAFDLNQAMEVASGQHKLGMDWPSGSASKNAKCHRGGAYGKGSMPKSWRTETDIASWFGKRMEVASGRHQIAMNLPFGSASKNAKCHRRCIWQMEHA